MQVANSERIVCFDVDQTLLFWDYDEGYTHEERFNMTCPHDGEVTAHSPHRKHIWFLKKLKARNFYTIVWSSNGTAWAEAAVKALGLEDHVDLVMSKPEKIVDDLPNQAGIIPAPIFLENR